MLSKTLRDTPPPLPKVNRERNLVMHFARREGGHERVGTDLLRTDLARSRVGGQRRLGILDAGGLRLDSVRLRPGHYVALALHGVWSSLPHRCLATCKRARRNESGKTTHIRMHLFSGAIRPVAELKWAFSCYRGIFGVILGCRGVNFRVPGNSLGVISGQF